MTTNPPACKSCGTQIQNGTYCDLCQYVSPAGAAKLLHISMATFWRWVKDGKVLTRKIGPRKMLVIRAEIERILSGDT